MHVLLCYDYLTSAADKRARYREAHLALVQRYVERGELLLGGAFATPGTGAAVVFDVADVAQVEEFVRNYPYVLGGIVSRWRIHPWSVTVGAAL